MLDKKKIWAKFLFKFKCVIKQQRQLSTSTTYLTQELLANVQWSGSSRSFAKKTRALKMRGIVASHQILTTINWEGHQNWCSENYRRSCRGTHINHSTVIQHLKQTGKVKKLHKWAPYEVTTNQKNHFSVSCSFILCNNNEPFLNWIVTWRKLDYIQQLVKTSSVVRPRRSFKALPKAKLVPKKLRVTVWYSAADLTHYSFLNPGKRIQYIWAVHSANRWAAPKTAMPAGNTGQQKWPNYSPGQHTTADHTTNTSKVEQIGLQSFASSSIFIWPFTNQLQFLQASQQLFAGKTLPQPARGRKWFPRVCPIL